MPIVRLALVVTLGVAALQEPQPFNQRPASVNVTLANSHRLYDGAFSSTGIAAVCGIVPKDMNFSGEEAFIVQFPDGTDLEVQDVTFNSKELVGKVTTSARFFLSVTVQSPQIGHPPKYVLDTSRPGNSGTATLSSAAAGALELKVTGRNDMGATVALTLACRPRSDRPSL